MVDSADDQKIRRPMAPKEAPKKLIQYIDNQVASTEGERFKDVRDPEAEEMKATYVNLKPARKYRFHGGTRQTLPEPSRLRSQRDAEALHPHTGPALTPVPHLSLLPCSTVLTCSWSCHGHGRGSPRKNKQTEQNKRAVSFLCGVLNSNLLMYYFKMIYLFSYYFLCL